MELIRASLPLNKGRLFFGGKTCGLPLSDAKNAGIFCVGSHDGASRTTPVALLVFLADKPLFLIPE